MKFHIIVNLGVAAWISAVTGVTMWSKADTPLLVVIIPIIFGVTFTSLTVLDIFILVYKQYNK